MRQLALACLALLCLAMGRRPEPKQDLYSKAIAFYVQGDYEDAGSLLHALSGRDLEAHRAWLCFLFERQGFRAPISPSISSTFG